MDVARCKADGGRPTGGRLSAPRGGVCRAPLCSLHHIHHYLYVTRPGQRPGARDNNGRTGSIRDAEPRADSDAFAVTFVPCPPAWWRGRALCVRSKINKAKLSAAAAVASRGGLDHTPNAGRWEIEPESVCDRAEGPRMRTIQNSPCMACGQPSHLRAKLHTVTECMVMNFERHGDLRPGLTGRHNPGAPLMRNARWSRHVACCQACCSQEEINRKAFQAGAHAAA